MRGARIATAAAVLLAVTGIGTSHATASHAEGFNPVVRLYVNFAVANPLDPGAVWNVRGTLVMPDGCTSSVLLAEHGLSYGRWVWDLPDRPETYSMAQGLAGHGHAMLAIDELGYGASDHPNGYGLTVQSYASITDQIVQQLRAGTYHAADGGWVPAFNHVGLIGHGAGSEIVELAAGGLRDADALIVTGYEHTPTGVSQEWLAREWIAGDNTRAAQGDYEYFESDPHTRAGDMYSAADADPEVVAEDTRLANPTPSGEVYSLDPQPSRAVIGGITVPTLMVLAAKDALYPVSGADGEMSLFAAAADRTLRVVAGGHALMLHRNAPEVTATVSSWLDNHEFNMPRCE